MQFLHHGLPKPERVAEWKPDPALSDKPKSKIQNPKSVADDREIADRLFAALRNPTAASKEWIGHW